MIDLQGVSSTRHFMGGMPRTHKARAANINRIESKEVMRSESTGKHTVYYEVFASLKVGQKVLLAQQIEGERAVNLVIKHFNERLGLSRKYVKKEYITPKTSVEFEVA